MGSIVGVAAAIAAAMIVAGSPPATSTTPTAAAAISNRDLAADVMFGCADSRDRRAQTQMSRAGISGIVLLGDSTPSNLGRQLRSVRRAAPGMPPMIASDEEGGSVQRLADVIRPLPSAETMGRWSLAQIRRTAKSYGRAMAELGVHMSLAPVADLRVPGSYIDDLNRAFSSNPKRAGRAVIAWSRGLEAAGVIPVPKHWPGHGHAVDTHESAATIPAYKRLVRADLVPFQMAFDAGAPAVMVGHLQSRGLTRPGVPATQSPTAMARLRAQVGPETVIITDSLSMAAASSARGLSEPEAAIAALRAGADWAMVCSERPMAVVDGITRALKEGRLDRAQLLESARRIDTLRASVG